MWSQITQLSLSVCPVCVFFSLWFHGGGQCPNKAHQLQLRHQQIAEEGLFCSKDKTF